MTKQKNRAKIFKERGVAEALPELDKLALRKKQIEAIINSLEQEEVEGFSAEERKRLARHLGYTMLALQSASPGYYFYNFLEPEKRAKTRLENVIRNLFFQFYKGKNALDGIEIDYEAIKSLITETLEDVRQYRDEYRDKFEDIIPGVLDADFQAELNDLSEPEVIESKKIGNGITLDYQESKWGITRVLLDGVQNHLPKDSGGTVAVLQFFDSVKNKWVPQSLAKQLPKKRISKVRFADDGKGFDHKLLVYLKSTKTNDEESAGQFGEGIKMIAAAALRNGLDIEYVSRDWRARPFAKEEQFVGPDGKVEDMRSLNYKIDTLGGKPIRGSRTIFHNPTSDFLDQVMELEKDVLIFREGYSPIERASHGEVVELDSSDLFLKGIMVTPDSRVTLASYNFFRAEPNRDRDSLKRSEVNENVISILSESDNYEFIRYIIKNAVGLDDVAEVSSSFNPRSPHLWKKAFIDLYGDRALLAGITERGDKVLAKKGYNLVRVRSNSFLETLAAVGIPVSAKVFKELPKEKVESSVTLEATDRWTERQVLLDIVQNHLPEDSGGSKTYIDFQIDGGDRWFSFGEVSGMSFDDVTAVRFADDGDGYDHQNLGVISSSKKKSKNSVGQFGEGLKMSTAAALRMGMGVECASRDWRAVAGSSKREIDGRIARELTFDLGFLRDSGEVLNGSETIISKPNVAFLKLIRQLPSLVLHFNSGKKVLDRIYDLEILDTITSNGVYNKGILITQEYRTRLVASYNLHTDEIPRDRDTVKESIVLREVKSCLENTGASAYITKVLITAEKHPENSYFEFQTFKPKDKQAWRASFYSVFGGKAVLIGPNTKEESIIVAAHRGKTPIFLNKNITEVLMGCGVKTVIGSNNEWYEDLEYLDESALTVAERKVLNFRHKVDPHLPGNSNIPIRVFESNKDELTGGFYSPGGLFGGEMIGINRRKLQNLIEFVDVYVHEKAHQVTGADDETREHFNYASRLCAILLLDTIGADGGVREEAVEQAAELVEALS